MYFRSDNPENDAIVQSNYLDSLNAERVRTKECDVCYERVEDFRLSPDKKSVCCIDCLASGKAKGFYLEHHTEQEVNIWLENLKVK